MLPDEPQSPDPTREAAVREALRTEGVAAAAVASSSGVAADGPRDPLLTDEVGALTDYRIRVESEHGDRLEGWVTSDSVTWLTLQLDNGAKLALDREPWRGWTIISKRDPDGTTSAWTDHPRVVEFVEPDPVLEPTEHPSDVHLFQLRDALAHVGSPMDFAAIEVVEHARWLDRHLTAGGQLPMEWRPELTSPDEEPEKVAVAGEPDVHLRVTHMNGTSTVHPVSDGDGWRVDTWTRSLVIGRGLGRVHIPLDNVASYSPEECR